jgi:hypothetical protein
VAYEPILKYYRTMDRNLSFFRRRIAVLLFDSAKPDCYSKSIVLWIV